MPPKAKTTNPTREFQRQRYDRPLIEHYLKHLADLERQTDPAQGEESAVNKDGQALGALYVASQLVEVVVGWALDHQYASGEGRLALMQGVRKS